MDSPGSRKGGVNLSTKKSKTQVADLDATVVDTEIATEKKNPSPKKSAGKTDGFCVYIGPSIRGVIQSGTIYGGSLEETIKKLSPIIEKYPLIAKLISTHQTIAEDRIKVKTAGNLLNVYYRQLAGK